LNLRLKRPSIPRGFLQDSCYREGGIGRGEVSVGAREMSRVKKSQNPSFRAGRTPRAETRAGGRRSVPNTPPAQRVQLICSVPADDRTNYPTEDSRCGQSSAQIRSGSRPRDCVPMPLVDLPDSTRTLTVTLRSLWNRLNLAVRFLTILCLTRGVTC